LRKLTIGYSEEMRTRSGWNQRHQVSCDLGSRAG
jgi:hypothetical protein